jgi:hypothetical protein
VFDSPWLEWPEGQTSATTAGGSSEAPGRNPTVAGAYKSLFANMGELQRNSLTPWFGVRGAGARLLRVSELSDGRNCRTAAAAAIPASHVRSCAYKGITSQYWAVRIGDAGYPDLAWSLTARSPSRI